MKALTLLQPWAELVITGFKTIETRKWNTNYRGKILIHAGISRKGMFVLQDFNELSIFKTSDYEFGALIGMATLTGVEKIENLPMTEIELNSQSYELNIFGNISSPGYAWMLEDAIQFPTAIKCKGHLNLWNFPDDVLQKFGIDI